MGLEDIKSDAKQRMGKSVEALQQELARVRTGRAQASLLDHIRVPYYGQDVPVSQVATVSVSDARTITVTPWEKNMVGAVEKAILTSDLGLNPNTSGQVIRIIIPALTEERRKELSKVVSHEAENAKVAVRNIRRDANHHVKELLKSKEITEDDERHAEAEIQKLTDHYVKEIDGVAKAKEEELMAL
ncbi:MAG: ribosome recycling factor [Xanthomonadales bacterium]|nr:ribosome recycling factor [Xanthomonadales bacterium]